MTAKVEFFFDLSSPWTYLAFHNIRKIIQETGAAIFWRPILVGGVFNAVNQAVYTSRDDMKGSKAGHYAKSLKDWAAWSELPMQFPSVHHPLKSVLAMRVCCTIEEDQGALETFMTAAFGAYFGAQANLDDPQILALVADKAGFNGRDLIAKAQQQVVKDRLRTNTQDLIARGGYGSPSIFVNHDDMYFGNDQLPLIRRAIEGK